MFLEWFNEVWKTAPNAIEEELEKPEAEQDRRRIDDHASRMQAWLQVFESLLEGRDHLFGEFSAADCAAFPFLKFARLRDPADDEPLPPHPGGAPAARRPPPAPGRLDRARERAAEGVVSRVDWFSSPGGGKLVKPGWPGATGAGGGPPPAQARDQNVMQNVITSHCMRFRELCSTNPHAERRAQASMRGSGRGVTRSPAPRAMPSLPSPPSAPALALRRLAASRSSAPRPTPSAPAAPPAAPPPPGCAPPASGTARWCAP